MMKKSIAFAMSAALVAGSFTAVPAQAKTVKKAKKITITNKADLSELKVGDTFKLKVEQKPKGAKDTIAYKSSDKKVVTVTKKGKIKAVAPGKATVSVTAQKGKITKKVKVKVAAEAMTALQTGGKTITVTCGSDMLEQDITVKRGDVSISFTKELSDDGKTAILTTNQQLQDAEYVVTVGEESVTIAAQAAVATTIELASDKLALNDYPNAATGAFIGYRVLDQFGGDVTAKTELTASCGYGTTVVDNKSGLISVTGDAFKNYLVGQTTTISVYSSDYAQNLRLTAQVTVSDAPVITDVTMQLYSPEGAILTDDFKGNEAFYIIFTLKDQYGNIYNEKNRINEKVFDSLNVYMASGITDLALNTGLADATKGSDVLKETLTVNNEKYLAVPLTVKNGVTYATKGTATVQAYSTGGANASCEVDVEYGTTIDQFLVTGSETVTQGKDIEFTYEALDAYGNEVTKLSAYRALLANNEEFRKNFRFAKENNEIKLYHRENSADELGYHNVVVITPKTKASSTFHYTVMAKSRPTEIAGLTGIETGVVGKGTITFMLKHFIINDQYGNRMTNDELYDYNGIFTIVPSDPEDKDSFTYQGTHQIELDSTGKIKVKLNYENASRNISFKLCGSSGQEIKDLLAYNAAGVINTSYDKIITNLSDYSEFTQKIVSAKAKNLNDFYATMITKLYYGASLSNSYSEELYVYGKTGNSTVKLSTDEYSVVLPSEGDIPYTDGNGKVGLVYDKNNNKLYCNLEEGDFIVDDAYVNSLTRQAQIIISTDAENPITMDIEICKETPKVVSASLKTTKGVAMKELTVSKSKLSDFAGYMETELGDCLRYNDQYGASDGRTNASKPSEIPTENMAYTMSISDIESEKGIVSGNGTRILSFTGFEVNDTFTLTFTFPGGATLSTTVVVTD
ncbi:MAG: Ig-like domain-containing protein [Lachnospiraceae bacterium]